SLMGGLAGFDPVPPGSERRLLPFERPAFRPWMLALLPVVGGLLGSLLTHTLAPDAQGPGTDAAIDAYHNRQGRIPLRIPFVKTLASALTLGSGGSAGREGPIAQIGAGLGSLTAVGLGLTARERRLLMVAGMAAGIGAIFRAPLAAALFSAEILYREMDMEFEVIVPSVISSIVGYSVFTLVMGSGALFSTPAFGFSPVELIPYTLLALVVAFGARSYVKIFYLSLEKFRELPVSPVLKPMLGGLGAGVFAFFLPEALGHGYGVVQGALNGELGWGLLLAVALGKTVTTAFTVGSGQSGGVFGPAIVIGGALSGAVGALLTYFMEPICPHPGAFVLVGMAGFFAAAANTPISTIIMVSEITGNYRLLVPSMWVCIIAFMLVRRSSLYVRQLDRRTDSPVHLGEMMGEVLDRLTVQHALSLETSPSVPSVRADAPLSDLKYAFSQSHHATFPVEDTGGRFLGVVDDQALRLAICDDAVRDVLVAADLVETAPSLFPSESLHSAMHKMVSSGHDELVVIDENDEERAVGMLSRRDLVATYDHQIQKDQDLRDRTHETAWSF
ncbi:MAG: chloride channel protein, partial [Myxococcota bacterium]